MKNINMQFKKIFTSFGFYLCVLFTIILFFCAKVYTDTETMSRYSVIRAVLDFDRGELSRHFELCNLMVMQNARNGWITLFVPIVTAFCFVPQMCIEIDANAVRYQIYRSTKIKFNLSRYFSGIISGGIAVAIGYTVFCGIVLFLFPSKAEFAGIELQMLSEMQFDFMKELLGIWLYGVFWSSPAMLCTGIMRNKYLIVCIPFFIKYGLSQTAQMLSERAYADFDNVNYKLAKAVNIVRPEALMFFENNLDYNWSLLFFGIISVMFLIGYLVIQNAWRDCGV